MVYFVLVTNVFNYICIYIIIYEIMFALSIKSRRKRWTSHLAWGKERWI